jgi:integrase
MAKVVLTDRFIKSKKNIAKGKRTDYFDALVPGLAVRVTHTGQKTFVLIARYPSKPKNPTRRALGTYYEAPDDLPVEEQTNRHGALTLAEARGKAREWLELIGRGIDPRINDARQKAAERRKAVSTFKVIAEAYLDRHTDLAKHGEAKRIMDAEFIKRWGDRPAADILPEEVAEVIRTIVSRGAAYQAHNSLGHLRRVYNWAIGTHEFGLVSSPVTALKPKDLIGGKKPRIRVLTDDELRAVWKVAAGKWTAPTDDKRVRAEKNAEDLGYPYGPLVRLLILTGQRENEIAGISWSEIDFDSKLLTIPASRMKGKDSRTHEVPLAPDALALLKSLPRFSKGDYVFTTTAGKKPVNGFSQAKERINKLSNVTGWVFHDLRRTMRTHLSALPVQDMVRELVIAHAQPGLHKVYDQHSYRDEKRECLMLWEARLNSLLNPKPPVAADNIEAELAA